MARLGMPLYPCQTPDGYTEAAWLSPDAATIWIGIASLLSGAFVLDAPPAGEGATQLVSDRTRSFEFKPRPVEVATLLSPSLSDQISKTVVAAPVWLKLALAPGSPDFMRR